MNQSIMTEYPTCKGTCGRKIRPRGSRATNHPGTISNYIGGRCNECHRQLKLGYLDRIPSVEKRIKIAAPGFYAYLQQRRKDGVPEEGKRFKETV